MSALPPEADMCDAKTNVRFVPVADMQGVNRSTDFLGVAITLSSHTGDGQWDNASAVSLPRLAHGGDEQSFPKFVGRRRQAGRQRCGLGRASDRLGRLRLGRRRIFCDF